MLKIITDSASDLPKEYIDAHHLHVIPTPVVIDETDYLDGKTILTKEFYNILDDTKRDIRTYHINPAMFEEAFPLVSPEPLMRPISPKQMYWNNTLIST